MQRISPFLWFDTEAEAAARFYVSVFDNSRIGRISRYGKGGPGPEGTVMVVAFELDGQEFLALNGGPQFKFSPAVSFVVNCGTQAQIDHLWDRLSEGGRQQPCGWLQDQYGLSWQIVPAILGQLGDGDPDRTNRVMQAMMQMKKLDIERLTQARDG